VAVAVTVTVTVELVVATLASLAAKRRTHPRTRDQDFSDLDRAVTYLNHQHMPYDKALADGGPIATGLLEGACRRVIEDRFGIPGARWSPDGAEDIRYDPTSIPDLGLTTGPRPPGMIRNHPTFRREAP
jgi:hypothetical protein